MCVATPEMTSASKNNLKRPQKPMSAPTGQNRNFSGPKPKSIFFAEMGGPKVGQAKNVIGHSKLSPSKFSIPGPEFQEMTKIEQSRL